MSDPFALAGEVRLQPGREASVRRRHPWVYRGALAAPLPPGPGPLLLRSAGGARLGVALPGSSGGSLALRVVAFAGEPWDRAALGSRLEAAVALRRRLAIDADAYRLVHAEGDELPGLVVDRYGSALVVELYEAAWRPYLPEATARLLEATGATDVLLRRGDARGAPPEALAGRVPDAPVVIREGAVRYLVDLVRGQKTGFFLDQRDNRRRVAGLAAGATVLNLFSYSGGFAIAALASGAASTVNVEASAGALELARAGCRLNDLAAGEESFVAGDAFTVARAMAASGRRFDVVVVDPPAFVKRQVDLHRGLQGYRDINLQALRLLSPGGLLLTCSCSALVSEEAFAQALGAAALGAGRTLRVLEWRGAGPDHPVALSCPESRHLKALLCAA